MVFRFNFSFNYLVLCRYTAVRNIPLWAQIVSIADVYDALVSPRCYKKAFSFEVALGMIVSGECGVFNPNILACFREIEGKLRTLYGSGPERLYE